MENTNTVSVLFFVPEGYENLDKIRIYISEQTFSDIELIIIYYTYAALYNDEKYGEKAEGRILTHNKRTSSNNNLISSIHQNADYYTRFIQGN